MGAEGAAVNSGAFIAGVLTILFVAQTLVVLSMFRFTREMIDNLYQMLERQQGVLESLTKRLMEQGSIIDELSAMHSLTEGRDSIAEKEDADVC